MTSLSPDLQLASDFRTVVTRMIKKLRTKNTTGDELSLTERSALALLYEQKEMLPSELALAEKITSQSMSTIVNHLLQLGYINRKASQTDKRKVLVSLTKAGRDVISKRRHERDEWLSFAITQTLSLREQDTLRKLIEPLQKLVEFE